MSRLSGAGALLACLLLAACSAGGAGPQSPPPATTTAAATGPGDLTGRHACATVPEPSLAAVSLDARSATDTSTAVASACRWLSADRALSMTVVLNASFSVDLLLSADGPEHYTESTIAGRRAVWEGAPSAQLCTVYVVPVTEQVISVEFASDGTGPAGAACRSAERVAADVLGAVGAG